MVLIECVELPACNQHLPEPWKLGEKAIYIGEIENEDGRHAESYVKQFVVLKRLPSKSIQTESRKCFKFLTKSK